MPIWNKGARAPASLLLFTVRFISVRMPLSMLRFPILYRPHFYVHSTDSVVPLPLSLVLLSPPITDSGLTDPSPDWGATFVEPCQSCPRFHLCEIEKSESNPSRLVDRWRRLETSRAASHSHQSAGVILREDNVVTVERCIPPKFSRS